MKTKEKSGYEWIECNSGTGYWRKITGFRHSHALPFFCPYEACVKKITGTIDDEYILKYGICRNCYTLFVADRQNPLINVEEYAKRFRERGY